MLGDVYNRQEEVGVDQSQHRESAYTFGGYGMGSSYADAESTADPDVEGASAGTDRRVATLDNR